MALFPDLFGFRRRRRRRLRARPFPPEWQAIAERNVPYCRHLTEDERAEMRGHVQVFLAEKRFEGCGGLEITDEIRVTIATQACLLLLGRDTDYYPDLSSILVYPHAFIVKQRRRLPGGAVEEGVEGRLGESWSRGEVVLSWDDVLRGAADVHDGMNLVFHEFAHQLDNESGPGDGTPALERRSMYIAWARVLGREYQQLLDDIEHDRETLLRTYGAKNPAEFFAVATEVFFEKPEALRARHPELYDQLKGFYRQDPAARCGFGGDCPQAAC
jgi:Mlc titration factor MtfA (ptsG expression regulator)